MNTKDETLNAYFVTVGESTSNDDEFAKAQQLLRNHIPDERIRTIKPSEGFALIASGRLTKTDVFVFNRFEGDFFRQLQQQTKSLLVGPRCLRTCLMRCEPIPLGTSPVFTTAMRDLQISATGIPAKEKDRLRVLIEWMGGHYFGDFGRSITHLISNTVKSTKYEQATVLGIPVMHFDWVTRVWERSCIEDISATDQEFDKFKLPIFFAANITCSGLNTEKKNQISMLINDNGGTYHSCFRSHIVDIVITEKNKTNSDKYKAAVRFKKDILLPEWIFDSVEKGFALPIKAYVVKAINASTPTKNDQSLADFISADNTQLSDMTRHVPSRAANLMASINDTVCSELGTKNKEKSPTNDLQRIVLKQGTVHYRSVLEEISLKQARKAGSFLDGCFIFLSGFKSQEREKLNRILNVGGATRYDTVNEKITHIIVGELDGADYRSWKKDGILAGTHIVRLDWLLESIKAEQPASEAIYRLSLPSTTEPEVPSPSSKKTLRSMNHSFKQPGPPTKKKLFDAQSPASTCTADHFIRTELPKDAAENIHPDAHDENNLIAQYSEELLDVPVPLPPISKKSLDVPRPSMNNDSINNLVPIASSTQCAPNATLTAAIPPQPVGDETAMTTANTIDYEHLNFLDGHTLFVFEKHFRDELFTQIVYECESAKADVVTSKFRDVVDYAVVSFEHVFYAQELPVNAKHIVNDLYVETCLKQNTFVPIEYYHRPIPSTVKPHILADMTIVVSIYTDLERDYIDSLAELLGARVNKTFAKKERPLLICPHAEGSKYQGAIKWGYPVVTAEWLQQCGEQGVKLPFTHYLVGSSVSEFPISSTLEGYHAEKPQQTEMEVVPMQLGNDVDGAEDNSPGAPSNSSTLKDKDGGETANNTAINFQFNSTNSTPLAAKNTPSDCTPLRNRRVSELVGNVANRSRRTHTTPSQQHTNTSTESTSPRTPTNLFIEPTYDLAIMESMLADIEDPRQRECVREIIDDIRKNPTPQLERIRRQACTPNIRSGIGNRWPSPKGVPDFCTTPAFKQRMVEEFEKRHVLPTEKLKPDTPISEIFKRVLYATCRAQGIAVSDYDDDENTQSLRPDTKQKDSKSNKRLSTSNAVQETNGETPPTQEHPITRTPRTLFEQLPLEALARNSPDQHLGRASGNFVPATQTPNRSVDACPTIVDKSTINFDKISFEDTQLTQPEAEATEAAADNVASSAIIPEVEQIKNYLKECEARRESFKRSASSRDDKNDDTHLSTRRGHSHGEDAQVNTEGQYVQVFETEQFCGAVDMVGWQDPIEFNAQRRFKPRIAPMQYQGKPCFSISCSQENVRQDIITKIQKLGGIVSENLFNYDPNCTHLLCEKLNRGEKTLGCMAAGKWILSLGYIDECHTEGKFIDEELFEWGNALAATNNSQQITNDEANIAKAACRWRREMQSSGDGGVFANFRCILRLSERHVDAFRTVIKAGKGEVITSTSPYNRNNRAHLATHCFVDMKKNPLNTEDYKFLTNNNVEVLSQMYINDYLTHGRNVDKTHLIIKM